jgi:alkylation response protein AidB-like acyl-CoA dehydrogenase
VDAFRVVRNIARADTSIAQILSYHYLLSHSAFWRSSPAQAVQLVRDSVEQKWFWGGASNPRDPLTSLTAEGEHFILNGRKTFASNASLADRITLRAAFGDSTVLLAVPGDSQGIVHGNDWDAFGQRLTESGSIEFHDVRIERAHILGNFPPAPNDVLPPLTTLVVPIHQLLFVNFYLGTAEGALSEANTYVRTTAKPWQTSGVNVMPPWLTGGFDAFVDHVVPLLRKRGLFREEYCGTTLRDHYGLPRPDSLFAHQARAIA